MTAGILKFVWDDLDRIKKLIMLMEDVEFTKQLETLSFATVGQHVRHILEFYLSISIGPANEISYDNRKQNILIETVRKNAIDVVELLVLKLSPLTTDKAIILKANYSLDEVEHFTFQTSLHREFAYALEHSIHHQAIIRIGLLELGFNINEIESWGVAPASIRHRRKN